MKYSVSHRNLRRILVNILLTSCLLWDISAVDARVYLSEDILVYLPEKAKALKLEEAINDLSRRAEADLWPESISSRAGRQLLARMEKDLKKRLRGKKDFEDIVSDFNKVIFEQYGFGVDPAPLFENDPVSTLLGPVLKNREGNCLPLSLVYLILAERVNVPIKGVMVPRHFFVRFEGPDGPRNIEATDGGKEFPDEAYRQQYYRRPQAQELRSLTRQEVVAVYLNNLGNLYKMQGRLDQAVNIFKTAIKIMPNQASFFVNLGNAYERGGQYGYAGMEYDKALLLDPYLCEAHYNLGLLHFLYTHRYDLAQRHGQVARSLGCRMHPQFQEFLEEMDAAAGHLPLPQKDFER